MSGTEPDRSDLNPTETGKHPQPEQGNPEQPGNPNLGLRDGKLTLESLTMRKGNGRSEPPRRRKARVEAARQIPRRRVSVAENHPGTERANARPHSRYEEIRFEGNGVRDAAGEAVSSGHREDRSSPIGQGLAGLVSTGATADEAIHNVRKRFKRVRAVLRLVRGELGNGLYRKENGSLRARRPRFPTLAMPASWLMPWRSCDVAMATSRRPLSTPVTLFQGAAARYPRRLARNVEAMDELREAIERGRSRATEWPLPRDGRRAVRRGLRRSCKAGAKSLEDAEKETTSENLHECRKQAKYLYHQVQLLQPVASPDLIRLGEQLHELEEKLGDDHDLGMLRVEVAACVAGGLPDVNERVLALIDEWRKELQTDCLQLAQKIYRDESATLRHRFRDCSKQLAPKKR